MVEDSKNLQGGTRQKVKKLGVVKNIRCGLCGWTSGGTGQFARAVGLGWLLGRWGGVGTYM